MRANRPPAGADDDDDDDESVDAFFTRRFGAAFARTLGSALVHGIYATDSRKLSVRAAFPMLRVSEQRGNGSVVCGELGPAAWFRSAEVQDVEEWQTGARTDTVWDARIAAAALLSFTGGMETLVCALVDALRGFRNVTLRSDTAVRTIVERDGASTFEVRVCVRACMCSLLTFIYMRRSTWRTSRSRSKLHI